MAISSELEQLLAGWIPRQPWFPKLAADFGYDPDITPMSVARAFSFHADEIGDFTGLVTVISVGDGPTLRRLSIPLSLRSAEDMHLRPALIGQVDDLALGPVYVYDGAADPVYVNMLADAIMDRRVFDGGQLTTESLRRDREAATADASASSNRSDPFRSNASSRRGVAAPDPAEVLAGPRGGAADPAEMVADPAEVLPPRPSKASLEVAGAGGAGAAGLGAAGRGGRPEEIRPVDVRPIEVGEAGANTSVVVLHDEYEPMEMTFFRLLENGMPSSLTIPVLLTEAGSRSVPEVIGWSSGKWYDMFEVTQMEAPMALLTRVDLDAEPAWREAVDIVCSVDSGSIGGYNAQAAEMGRRVGELHADMAAEFGIVEGLGEPTRLLVKKWTERIDWALGRAPLALDSLVPELRKHRARLLALDSIGSLQKIHGELTLDHVVSSPTEGYTVVKFTDSSNSDPKPAAFDLVALLRSIDYAAGFARLQRTGALDSEDGGLVVNGFGHDAVGLRAIYDSPEYLWASQVQNSLLSGYSRARGETLDLGNEVLRAALIDRLLVETVTELRNRPNWLSVPLSTLTLILKGKPARSYESVDEDEGSSLASVLGAAGIGGAAAGIGGEDILAGASAAGEGADSADDGDDDESVVDESPAAVDASDGETASDADADDAPDADEPAVDEPAEDEAPADEQAEDTASEPEPEPEPEPELARAETDSADADAEDSAPEAEEAEDAEGSDSASADEESSDDEAANGSTESASVDAAERDEPVDETPSDETPSDETPAGAEPAEVEPEAVEPPDDEHTDDEDEPHISPVPATFAAKDATDDEEKDHKEFTSPFAVKKATGPKPFKRHKR